MRAAFVVCRSSFVLLLAFALLYLLTLDTGLRPGELEGGDLITHQYAQVQGRPSNAPGYPLYTMGGWLWFHLGRLLLGPDHNPIPILASYSTLWALVALWLLYRLILEVTDATPPPSPHAEGAALPPILGGWGGRPVALLVTAFYGVTYFFWYYAVTTEQYTSAVAWTLAVVWLAFRWERTRRDGYLLGMALLIGVGLAHMVTVLFIVPPLLWFILGRGDPLRSPDGENSLQSPLLRRPKLIAAALALAALPLLSYVFVYVRGAQHPEWRGAGQWASAWQWFWSFISTRQGRSELTWSWTPFWTTEFPSLIWGELTVPGLIAGLVGLAAVGHRRAIMLYATLAIYLVFCWIDRLGNWYQVIMPAYALLTVGIAAGADWVWRLGGGAEERRSRGAGERGRTGERERGGVGERSLSHSPTLPFPGFWQAAVVVGLIALLAYRGIVSYPRADSRGRPEDTGLIPGWAILADDPPPETAVLGTLPETLALNYLTEIWEQRPDLRSVTSDQARVILAAGAPPPWTGRQGRLAVTEAVLPLVPAEISPDAHYSALGRTLVAVSASPNRALPADLRNAVTLQPWTHDFGSELRLLGGRLVTPCSGRSPWPVGQDGPTEPVAAAVARSGDRPQRALPGSGRSPWPVGQDGPTEPASEPVVLLVWQALTKPSADWSVSVRLAQGGREIAQVDRQHPVAGAYPTGRWTPGEVVADAYPFTLPPGAVPDELVVLLYRRTADGGFVNLDVARFTLP